MRRHIEEPGDWIRDAVAQEKAAAGESGPAKAEMPAGSSDPAGVEETEEEAV